MRSGVRSSSSSVTAILAVFGVCLTPAFAQNTDNAVVEPDDDVIVVTGIRQSLDQSVEDKRSVENIGKFPDENLAKSQQRITGVRIDRGSDDSSSGRCSVI